MHKYAIFILSNTLSDYVTALLSLYWALLHFSAMTINYVQGKKIKRQRAPHNRKTSVDHII